MAKAAKPEPTPFERFEETTKRLFQVSKKEIRKAEIRRKKEREAPRGRQGQVTPWTLVVRLAVLPR